VEDADHVAHRWDEFVERKRQEYEEAFPAHGLYRTYAPRAYGSRHIRSYLVELWLVNEDGSVMEQAAAGN
jgi:hypothetical protein